MGSKNQPGEYDCYSRAEPDEPMFVLLGRDPAASLLVLLWTVLRCGEDPEKRREAASCALQMAHYAQVRGRGIRVVEIWRDLFQRDAVDRLLMLVLGLRGTGVMADVETMLRGRAIEADVARDRMLRWFAYDHLPAPLQVASRQFHRLAHLLVEYVQPGPERSVALRKLLEGKDAAVRAVLHPGG